jgi:hypothetical protein
LFHDYSSFDVHVIQQNHIPHEFGQNLVQEQEKRAHEIHLVVKFQAGRLDHTDDALRRLNWGCGGLDQFIVPVDESSGPLPV